MPTTPSRLPNQAWIATSSSTTAAGPTAVLTGKPRISFTLNHCRYPWQLKPRAGIHLENWVCCSNNRGHLLARIHWPRRRVPVRDQAGRVGGWCESCQARHIQKRSGIFGCQFFFELLKLALSMLESVEVRLETLATRLILLRQQFPALLLLPGYPLLRHRIPGLCHLESGRYPSR